MSVCCRCQRPPVAALRLPDLATIVAEDECDNFVQERIGFGHVKDDLEQHA
jgi:hypothetical protein